MKKISQSPATFITIAIISLVIIFGAFFYVKTSLQQLTISYQKDRQQRLTDLLTARDSLDPLISQGEGSVQELTQPIIRSVDPKRGSDQAKVTIVEFSDFSCAYCNEVQTILKEVQQKYGNQVRIVWKDFPLTDINPETLKAARAAQCSRLQEEAGDVFWKYHDLLFANQSQFSYNNYLKWAKELGLNERVFADCIENNDLVNGVISQSIDEGNQLGVSGTPTFYVNDQLLSGRVTLKDFTTIIDQLLAK